MSNNQWKNKDLIVGLDIGTSKVVCLVGKYDSSDNLEILSLGTYPSSGLKKGVVVNIDATTDAIEKTVEQAQSLIDEKIRNIFVGIAGNHVIPLFFCEISLRVPAPHLQITKSDHSMYASRLSINSEIDALISWL